MPDEGSFWPDTTEMFGESLYAGQFAGGASGPCDRGSYFEVSIIGLQYAPSVD